MLQHQPTERLNHGWDSNHGRYAYYVGTCRNEILESGKIVALFSASLHSRRRVVENRNLKEDGPKITQHIETKPRTLFSGIGIQQNYWRFNKIYMENHWNQKIMQSI